MATDLWMKHPKTGVVVLVVHEDTQLRCLADGFTLAPDPRLPVAAPPDPTPVAAATEADTATDAAPRVVMVTGDDDLSIIADSPEQLTAALEATDAAEQRMAAIRARNTAARTAFGVETPIPPAASANVVKPKPPTPGKR